MMRYHVLRDAAGQPLESFLLHDMGLAPRAGLKRAFKAGRVTVNGRRAKRDDRVAEGDVVELDVGPGELYAKADARVAEGDASLELELALETPELLVALKPAGVASHPLRPDERGTALGALAARFPDAGQPLRPERPLEGGLVHRLDRGTSGLLVCARNPASLARLRAAWRSRLLEKVYLAWVGGFLERRGRIELRLDHSPKSRAKMVALPPGDEAGWSAVTSLAPLRTATLDSHEPATLVLIRIHTGVTHQIRATFAALGHPVLGDPVYRQREHGRAKPPEELGTFGALDSETKALFERLASRVKAGGEPDPASLPERGFFLHALWLRSDEVEELAAGLFAPAPSYFG